MRTLRVLAILAISVIAAFPQSYPSVWNYANPDANFLLGVDWSRLRQSPFGAMAKQRAGLADLGFLDNVNQILLAVSVDRQTIGNKKQPLALLILSGNFDLRAVRRAIAAKGMRPIAYHSVSLMMSRGKPGEEDAAVALIGEQTLLFGDRRSVMQAIDRNDPNAPRVFSAALASGAKLAKTHDVWIVAHDFAKHLGDEVEGPLRMGQDVTAIEAGLSLQNGIDAEAALTTASGVSAERLAAVLEAFKPQLPEALRNFGVASKENVVHLALSIDQQKLMAMIGQFTQRAIAKTMPAKSTPAPSEKMTIKIYGLDGGIREIPYPASQ